MKNNREEIKLTHRADAEKSIGIFKGVCNQSSLYTESSFDFIFKTRLTVLHLNIYITVCFEIFFPLWSLEYSELDPELCICLSNALSLNLDLLDV